MIEALKILVAIFQDLESGMRKKTEYEKKISLHEVFLESVPTCLVLTFIVLSAIFGKYAKLNCTNCFVVIYPNPQILTVLFELSYLRDNQDIQTHSSLWPTLLL